MSQAKAPYMQNLSLAMNILIPLSPEK
jgi:hypothetical protein